MTTFLGKENEFPIMNASCPKASTVEDLKELNSCSYTCAIVTKSCTEEFRQGNESPNYWQNDNITFNSLGLANQGYKYYTSLSGFNKPYILSVAGLTLEENLNIISNVAFSTSYGTRYVDAIELNLSCPNVQGKPVCGYDLDATRYLLNKLEDYECFERIAIGVKLPPYLDRTQLANMADLLSNFPIEFVTCINSLGNGLILDDNYDYLLTTKFGGVGGNEIVKAIGLSNCKQFREQLPNHIDVIGCGGIRTGRDVKEYLTVGGCKIVQIGSTLMKEGISCFERIAKEYKELNN